MPYTWVIAAAIESPLPRRISTVRTEASPPRITRSSVTQRAMSYPTRARAGSGSPMRASRPPSVSPPGPRRSGSTRTPSRYWASPSWSQRGGRFDATLALELFERGSRCRVPGLTSEERREVSQREVGLIALVVEAGQEQPHLDVVLGGRGAFEWFEGLARTPSVDRGDARGLEERGIVGQRLQALAKEQQRLLGPLLPQHVASPRFETARDVLTPHRALRIVGSRAAEALAGAGELPGGIELERGGPLSAADGDGGGDVGALIGGNGRLGTPAQEQHAGHERDRRDHQPAGSSHPHGGLPRGLDQEQRLPIFHGLPVLHEDLLDAAGGLRFDLVHELHRFDDAEDLALLDDVTVAHVRVGRRPRGAIERSDHRRLDGDQRGAGDDVDDRPRGRRGRRRHRNRVRRWCGAGTLQADLEGAQADLDLGEVQLPHERAELAGELGGGLRIGPAADAHR